MKKFPELKKALTHNTGFLGFGGREWDEDNPFDQLFQAYGSGLTADEWAELQELRKMEEQGK